MKKKRKIDCKRFQYNSTSGMILDDLTGKRYYGNNEVCKLLNEVSDHGDYIAEKYIDLSFKYKKVCRILRKYNIFSLSKLDLILFYSRIW